MSDYGIKTLAGAFRFVLWAQQLRRQPTIPEICDHWRCSRATAYRYRNALADSMCRSIERAPRGVGVPDTHRTGIADRRHLLTRAREAA